MTATVTTPKCGEQHVVKSKDRRENNGMKGNEAHETQRGTHRNHNGTTGKAERRFSPVQILFHGDDIVKSDRVCGVKPEETSDQMIEAREPNDQDVLDPELGSHAEERVESDVNEGDTRETHGYPNQPASLLTNAEGEALKAREVNNQDVYDPAIGYHQAEKAKPNAEGGKATEEDGYPWFATRVICHWLKERVKKHGTS